MPTVVASAAGAAPVREKIRGREAASTVARGRALLAEDNAVNRKVALLMLRQFGWETDTAVDGRQALEALAQTPYDVLLLDIQMPEVDGLEVARRVVATEPDPARRPWMIAVTANTVVGDREACMAAGIDDFVAKPIKQQELEAALRRALAHGPARSVERLASVG